MARYAMVHSSYLYVANVIEWDGNEQNWKPPVGFEMVEDKDGVASPGCTYEDGAFVPPPSGEAGEPA